MTFADALLVLVAGLASGVVNSVVGSAGLITFPVLLAVGLSPVSANVTNTLGVLPGTAFGALGYRRELRGQRARVRRLAPAAVVGGAAGALLLLVLPAETFEAVVPWLIVGAVVLVVLQPWVVRRLHAAGAAGRADGGAALRVGVLLTAVYGGFFGTAQGVILIGVLGALLPDGLHRLNATKNVLAFVANAVAAAIFLTLAWGEVHVGAAALLMSGAAVGGTLGGRYGRLLPERVLRLLVVGVGLVAAVATLL